MAVELGSWKLAGSHPAASGKDRDGSGRKEFSVIVTYKGAGMEVLERDYNLILE